MKKIISILLISSLCLIGCSTKATYGNTMESMAEIISKQKDIKSKFNGEKPVIAEYVDFQDYKFAAFKKSGYDDGTSIGLGIFKENAEGNYELKNTYYKEDPQGIGNKILVNYCNVDGTNYDIIICFAHDLYSVKRLNTKTGEVVEKKLNKGSSIAVIESIKSKDNAYYYFTDIDGNIIE